MTKTPENLYHYTSFENFTNIINSNELWMTDIRFLNDSSELNYAIELYKQYIKKIDKNPNKIIDKFKAYNPDFNKYSLNKLLSILLNLIKTVNNLHPYSFVFSFSEKGDLLSQWRGYTTFGKGISIGFNYERFSKEIHPDPRQSPNNLSRIGELLYRCLYSKKKLYEIVEGTLLEIYANNFSERLASIDFIDVWSECLHIKHNAFKEEKEWRLSAKLNDLKKIDHRTGSHSIIPIYKNKFKNISNYIDHIIIGPSPNMSKAYKGLKSFLGDRKIEIKISKIPYTGW